MTTRAEQPPVTTAAFILKVGTALLIMFAATLVLVHAEIYFSHPLTMQHCMSDGFSRASFRLRPNCMRCAKKDRALAGTSVSPRRTRAACVTSCGASANVDVANAA